MNSAFQMLVLVPVLMFACQSANKNKDHATTAPQGALGEAPRPYEPGKAIAMDPQLEKQSSDEAQLIANLIQALKTKMAGDVTQVDSHSQAAATGHRNLMLRDAHPKSPGCVRARFEVLNAEALQKAGLPDAFTKDGLLSPRYAGKSLDAVIRFSGATGVKPDNEADARGMAIKILGVEGEKWDLGYLNHDPTSPDNHFTRDSYYHAQDFVMIDNPTLPTPDIRSFAAFLALATNSGFKGALRSVGTVAMRPLQVKAALNFLWKTPTNLLTLKFYSITPYAWFGVPLKFSAQSTLDPQPMPADSKDPHILRKMMEATLAASDVVFDFKIQYRSREEPQIQSVIEDASQLWDETRFPFHTVAKIVIPKGQIVSDEKSLTDCDDLSFNIWNSLAHYQPVGGINRARRVIYETISEYRHEYNQSHQTR